MANVTVSSGVDTLLKESIYPSYVLASKGTTNQTGMATSPTFNEVTWTEIADTAGVFDSNRLVPPNGEAWQISFTITPSVGAAGVRIIGAIGKNGSEFIRCFDVLSSAAVSSLSGSLTVFGNGTDYYNILFWHNQGTDQSIYAGDGVNNYFSASRVG